MVRKASPLFLFAFTACLIAADQMTKFFARNLAESITVIKDFFYLTFVMNFGVAFGLLQGFNNVVVWLYVAVIGLIMLFYEKLPKDSFSQMMLFMIVAGIIGNFTDRIVFGYVTDFISFAFWPSFNLADLYIVAGIAGIIIKDAFWLEKTNGKMPVRK